MHRANGALAIGLLGMNLFQRRKRNDNASRNYFRILAQYRIISALVRMLGYGTVESQTIQHVMQEHGTSMVFSLLDQVQHVLLISKGVASAIARHIMFATPMAFVTDTRSLQSLIHEATVVEYTSDMVFNQILPFMHSNMAAVKGVGVTVMPSATFNWGGLLHLACDVALSCWFALRLVEKL